MEILIKNFELDSYNTFLKCKNLPKYEVQRNKIVTDKESYDFVFHERKSTTFNVQHHMAFDYQLWTVRRALERKCFAPFLDCGLGKTLIQLLWHETLLKSIGGKTLLLCPLSVVQEFIDDAKKFQITAKITVLKDNNYTWDEGIGILNFESRKEIDMRGVLGLSLDESSILKNHAGSTKKWLVSLSKNIEYRLACSATPSPNDTSEYGTHSVFLGVCRTEKEFFSRFFLKNGSKYELKPHARDSFYKFLQSFCCYIHDPSKLGFESGGRLADEPEYIVEKSTGGEALVKGTLIPNDTGFKQMKKIEAFRCESSSERFKKAAELAAKYKSILWVSRNDEENAFKKAIPNSALITGQTPPEKRIEIIRAWRNGEINTIISKAKILGWGVNLQQAEAHIYSGYDFSFEMFYQAVRRSHRYGRKGRLKVFLPAIMAEMPIIDALWSKMKSFEDDVRLLQQSFNA